MHLSSNSPTSRPTLLAEYGQEYETNLSPLEALILAQAVWELGADAWPSVAAVLSNHPLLTRPENFFTPQSCHTMYISLMKQANLECTESIKTPRAKPNLKLAQKHYQARVKELKDLIAQEESQFKKVAAEIQDIQAGKWDDKLQAQIVCQETVGSDQTPVVDFPEKADEAEPNLEEEETSQENAQPILAEPEYPPEDAESPRTVQDGDTTVPNSPIDEREQGGEIEEVEEAEEAEEAQAEAEVEYHINGALSPKNNVPIIVEEVKDLDTEQQADPEPIPSPPNQQEEVPDEDIPVSRTATPQLRATEPVFPTPIDNAADEEEDDEHEDMAMSSSSSPEPVAMGLDDHEVIAELPAIESQSEKPPGDEIAETHVFIPPEPQEPEEPETVEVIERQPLQEDEDVDMAEAEADAETETESEPEPVEIIATQPTTEEVEQVHEPASSEMEVEQEATREGSTEPIQQEPQAPSPTPQSPQQATSPPLPPPTTDDIDIEATIEEDAVGTDADGEAAIEEDQEEGQEEEGQEEGQEEIQKEEPQEEEPQEEEPQEEGQGEGQEEGPEEEEEESGESSPEEPPPPQRSSRRLTSTNSPVPIRRLRGKNRRTRETTITANTPVEASPEGDVTPKIEEEDEMPSPTPVAADGPSRRREGKRKASVVDNVDSPRERKRARDESEPAEEEESGRPTTAGRPRKAAAGNRTEEQLALKRFQNVIGMLHSQISQHRNGNIFHNPIRPSEAPDYHEIVKRPMDLKTIKMKVKDSAIGNSLEYQRDIYLMFANAMMYNRPGSDVYVMSEDMMLESEEFIKSFRQTEGLVRGAHRM